MNAKAVYMRKYYTEHPELRERAKKLNKESYRKLREKVNRFKMKPCLDCGIQYNPWIMQFDHRNPDEKLFNISQGYVWKRWPLYEAEMAKCDVVCANCHADRTYKSKHREII